MTTRPTLTRLSVAWLIMWSLCYIAVAIVAPLIESDLSAIILFVAFGTFLFVGTILTQFSSATPNIIGRIILFVLACLSIGSGVASWTGVQIWNVPFINIELFQVSMAFADLISAVFMFILAFEDL